MKYGNQWVCDEPNCDRKAPDNEMFCSKHRPKEPDSIPVQTIRDQIKEYREEIEILSNFQADGNMKHMRPGMYLQSIEEEKETRAKVKALEDIIEQHEKKVTK